MDELKPAPEVIEGVPYCTSSCPAYDGKRCRLTGFQPDAICEPAVREMAAELKLLKLKEKT